jgi:hypothetical protein
MTVRLCLLECLQAAACPCACSASSALLGSTARATGQQALGQPGTDSPGAETGTSTNSRYASAQDTAQQPWAVGAVACSKAPSTPCGLYTPTVWVMSVSMQQRVLFCTPWCSAGNAAVSCCSSWTRLPQPPTRHMPTRCCTCAGFPAHSLPIQPQPLQQQHPSSSGPQPAAPLCSLGRRSVHHLRLH